MQHINIGMVFWVLVAPSNHLWSDKTNRFSQFACYRYTHRLFRSYCHGNTSLVWTTHLLHTTATHHTPTYHTPLPHTTHHCHSVSNSSTFFFPPFMSGNGGEKMITAAATCEMDIWHLALDIFWAFLLFRALAPSQLIFLDHGLWAVSRWARWSLAAENAAQACVFWTLLIIFIAASKWLPNSSSEFQIQPEHFQSHRSYHMYPTILLQPHASAGPFI